MRELVIVVAFTFATSASAQQAKPSAAPPTTVSSTKPKPTSDDAEAARTRAINEARQKAWDEKTKRAMRGICLGC